MPAGGPLGRWWRRREGDDLNTNHAEDAGVPRALESEQVLLGVLVRGLHVDEILSALQTGRRDSADGLGYATASGAGDIVAGTGVVGPRKLKAEPASRRNYRVALMLERVTGNVQHEFNGNDWTRQGNDREAAALARYEAETGALVRRTGFLGHTQFAAGCSLDGDVEVFTGIVEAKCPSPAVHYEYLTTRTVPQRYACQITHAMWLTGARWGDFLSYCPEFPEELQTCLVRVLRDEEAIQAYEAELVRFLGEVDVQEAALDTLLARARRETAA